MAERFGRPLEVAAGCVLVGQSQTNDPNTLRLTVCVNVQTELEVWGADVVLEAPTLMI